MQELRIRKATSSDASLLAEAAREVAQIPGRLASHPSELQDQLFKEKIELLSEFDLGVYLVAEYGGEISGHGFLELYKLKSISHVADLTITIHEGWQGQGIGRKMMEALIDWAKSNNKVEKIELHVRSSNERALYLYRSLGFEEEGRRVKKIKIDDQKYIDDVCMGLWVRK